MESGSQLSLREIWDETLTSIGGWQGIGVLTVACYLFVLAIHFAIPLRHAHIRRLKAAAPSRGPAQGTASPSISRSRSKKVQ
jgi:hypothetical protein